MSEIDIAGASREFRECVNVASDLMHEDSAKSLVIKTLLHQAFAEGKKFAAFELQKQCERFQSVESNRDGT